MSSVQTDEVLPASPHVAHFRGFDGLRAIAALAVVVAHAAGWAGVGSSAAGAGPYLSRLGQFGVSVFFVISGFLLYRPYAVAHLTGKAAPDTAKFYRRRFFRIFPAYWVALIAFVYIGHYANARTVKQALQQFLLLQIYDARTLLQGLPQSWSLAVEISFYLLLPGIALVIARAGRALATRGRAPITAELAGIAALYAFGVLWRLGVLAFAPSMRSPTFSWLAGTVDWFALGMVFAVFSAHAAAGGRVPRAVEFLGRRPVVSWLFAAELYWLLVQLKLPTGFAPATGAQYMAKHFLFGIAAALLVAPAVFKTRRPSPIRSLLASWPMRTVGAMSYSVFLWHVLCLRVAVSWLDRPEGSGGFWSLLAVTLALTLPAAALSHWLIERPSMEWGRGRKRATHPAAAPAPAAPATVAG